MSQHIIIGKLHMPIYRMTDTETGETKDMLLSFSEREEMLESGKWEQRPATARLVSQVGSTIGKTPDSWKEHMRRLKKRTGVNSRIND
jgi:hypothetical protein